VGYMRAAAPPPTGTNTGDQTLASLGAVAYGSAQSLTLAERGVGNSNLGLQRGVAVDLAWANSETLGNMTFALPSGSTAAGPTLAANKRYRVRLDLSWGNGDADKCPAFNIAPVAGYTLKGGSLSWSDDHDYITYLTNIAGTTAPTIDGTSTYGVIAYDFVIDAGVTGGVMAFQFCKAVGDAVGIVNSAVFEAELLN
jgi:hypothetical protein